MINQLSNMAFARAEKMLLLPCPRSAWRYFLFALGCFYLFFCQIIGAQDINAPLSDIESFIAQTLTLEQKNIDTLQRTVDQVNQQVISEKETLKGYQLQYATYGNMMLLPDKPVRELEKAQVEIDESLHDIDARLAFYRDSYEKTKQSLKSTAAQMEWNEKQLSEMGAIDAQSESLKQSREQLQAIAQKLTEKNGMLKTLFGLYEQQIGYYKGIKNDLEKLSGDISRVVLTEKKQNLLKREESPIVTVGWASVYDDLIKIRDKIRLLFEKDFWQNEIKMIGSIGLPKILSMIILLGILLSIGFRLKRLMKTAIDKPVLQGRPWTRLTLLFIERSLHLILPVAVFYLIFQTGLFNIKGPFIAITINLLMVWLATKWFLDFLAILQFDDQIILSVANFTRLRFLIHTLRYTFILHLTIDWLYVENSITMILFRLLCVMAFYIWNLRFWKTFHGGLPQGFVFSPKLKILISISKLIIYIIIWGGAIIDLSGYGRLAVRWYASWGYSAVIILWASISFLTIREWSFQSAESQATVSDDPPPPSHTIQWILVQLFTVAWFFCFFMGLLFSWGGKQTVLRNLVNIIQFPVAVGDMHFSIIGLVMAVIVLLLTNAISRLWGHLFKENILKGSGIEEGLKDSITTITNYVIWVLGILIALNVFGFNITSITVGIGALGIGLGFGLQNIFNNFISGIILLFERPIQVGDDIEINGVWATVKKINVRSTVVQTYDNASLIIPNSDFISSQVTNWSFKDKRIRRNIEVGVAYGSDTELVRQTLLEVAEKTARILKFPKPDVGFKNFGDSALIFVLRIWTRLEWFYAVETEIRFEIDRLFRERQIEIAFPQRDIHIRSVTKDLQRG